MRVIDPWEEHCIECGEPECYKVCPKFKRSAMGRCARFVRGIEWRSEDGNFAKVVAFKEWGKLELLWHGRMASRRTGKVFDFLDRCMPPLMCRIRLFRWWRSLRLGYGGKLLYLNGYSKLSREDKRSFLKDAIALIRAKIKTPR